MLKVNICFEKSQNHEQLHLQILHCPCNHTEKIVLFTGKDNYKINTFPTIKQFQFISSNGRYVPYFHAYHVKFLRPPPLKQTSQTDTHYKGAPLRPHTGQHNALLTQQCANNARASPATAHNAFSPVFCLTQVQRQSVRQLPKRGRMWRQICCHGCGYARETRVKMSQRAARN